MIDREALAAALEKGKPSPAHGDWDPNSILGIVFAAARERLAQLPAHVVGHAGRPQEYDEPTINWNVRFPVSLHTRLKTAALERGRSMTGIVQVAVAAYLDAPNSINATPGKYAAK